MFMPDRSAKSANEAGILYVVATPIGNVGDLSPRAREVLASVALIAAEDTRHTGQMLQMLGIDTAITSLHEHNEAAKAAGLIARILRGESLALVSDAGTPLISDPGFDLISLARREGVRIVPVPGACAAIAALSVAGLPTDRFAFEGFLPSKSAARRAQLESLANETRTLIFYEGPHRIAATLEDLASVFGDARAASVSRELTKHFETTYRGTLAELARAAKQDSDMERGEIVIVVAGRERAQTQTALDSEQLLRALLEEVSPSQAARIAARLTGSKRAELYELALRTGKKRSEEAG
jgi:16S rRNA (cytidine1402-2'-O)-methyltransferase